MNKEEYQEYLNSDYWKGIREEVYKRDDYKCRMCSSNKNLCVHHRNYNNIGNENLDELSTLCKDCHETFHKNKTVKIKPKKKTKKRELTEEEKFKREYNDSIRWFTFMKNQTVNARKCLCCEQDVNLDDFLTYNSYSYYLEFAICQICQTNSNTTYPWSNDNTTFEEFRREFPFPLI